MSERSVLITVICPCACKVRAEKVGRGEILRPGLTSLGQLSPRLSAPDIRTFAKCVRDQARLQREVPLSSEWNTEGPAFFPPAAVPYWRPARGPTDDAG